MSALANELCIVPDTDALPVSIKHGADITDIQRVALMSEGYTLVFTCEGMYWCRPESTFHPESRARERENARVVASEYPALVEKIKAWRVRAEPLAPTASELVNEAKALTRSTSPQHALSEILGPYETTLIEHVLKAAGFNPDHDKDMW